MTAGRPAVAVRNLRILVAAVVAMLLCFYGTLAFRALVWTPRFFVRMWPAVVRAAPAGGAPISPWRSRDADTPEARGREVYYQRGCVACHGLEGKGGVTNLNAKTHEEIPALIYVKDSYKEDWLVKKIEEGVAQIDRMDPRKPAPPLRMPAWRGKLDDAELHDLCRYLFSLYPGPGGGDDR